MPTITFTVPGVPVPKGRPRFVPGGRCFTPQKTSNYEADLKYFFLKSIGCLFKPLDCPISLKIVAIFPMPLSAKKADKILGARIKTTKPDLDNVIKSVCDGLNKIAWVDDARIYCIEARKEETTGSPSVTIKIEWNTP
jgi:Holliday junction resolvase RusA-like endonuclease